MIVPEQSLSDQLHDKCPKDGQDNAPIVVDGNRQNPTAAYHCQCGQVYFATFNRQYVKQGSDALPSSSSALNQQSSVSPQPFQTAPAPNSIPQNSANPSDYLSSGTPTCKGCGAPLGSPHSLVCPVANPQPGG